MITTDNSQTLINALAEIERLKEQLKTETAMHESWQNEHLLVDGDQCRQIRELEAKCDALRKDAKRWQVIKTLFRVMSPDIDGNHTWVQSHYGTLRGGNMNQAVDNLIKQVGEK